jgi:predicted peroxiredoxin
MDHPARPRWVLLLRDADALPQAAGMAAAAVSLGTDVVLVWLSDALAALAAGRLEDLDAPDGVARLFAEARETGRVTQLACSADAARLEGGVPGVRDRVDEIVGWPTVVSLLRGADRSFVW